MKKKFVNCILIFIYIYEFIINVLYVKNVYVPLMLNSDSAGDAVFARHLEKTGKYLFSQDWFPTTELYVVHHQLIMVPLFKFFDNYSLVWVLTSIIAIILISASIFYFVKCFQGDKTKAFLAVVLFINPIINTNLDFTIYFHGYLFYYILGFILLGTLFKCQYTNKVSMSDNIIIIIFSFLSGLCGIRMFMLVFIPFIIAYVMYYYKSEIKEMNNPFTKIALLSLCASAFGFGIYFFVLSPIYGGGSQISAIKLNSGEIIKNNLLLLPEMIINGLSINFNDTEINLYAMTVFSALLLWLCVFFVVGRNCKGKGTFPIFVLWNIIILNIIFMILTIGNDSFVISARYFSLSIFLLIPMFVTLIKIDKKSL